jgi:hypothetical protein
LPAITELIAPAWFGEEVVAQAEGWSLVCTFDSPLDQSGNPAAARVHFMVENAPHERLKGGVILWLHQRGGRGYARVEVLD